jgi:hypothetical protein
VDPIVGIGLTVLVLMVLIRVATMRGRYSARGRSAGKRNSYYNPDLFSGSDHSGVLPGYDGGWHAGHHGGWGGGHHGGSSGGHGSH